MDRTPFDLNRKIFYRKWNLTVHVLMSASLGAGPWGEPCLDGPHRTRAQVQGHRN